MVIVGYWWLIYHRLLVPILLVAIGGHYIVGHWWLFYWWLLMAILLVVIIL
jgi:hypothetical protein